MRTPWPTTEQAMHPLAIVRVLMARYGALVWLPFVVWIVTALIARFDAIWWTNESGIISGPSVYFLQAVMGALIMMWLGTARLATALGHHRGHVFVVAIVLTAASLAGALLLTELANRAEVALVGVDGVRVLPTSDTPSDYIMPPPPLVRVMSGSLQELLLWLPLPFVVVMALCYFLRWRWLGLLGGAVAGLVLFVGHFFLFAMSAPLASGPRQDIAMQALPFVISMAMSIALSWLAFRRSPL